MTLEEKCLEIKKLSLELAVKQGEADIRSRLVYAETLAALYHAVLNVKPDEPDWEDRDRLMICRSALAAQAAALAVEGFIPKERLTQAIGEAPLNIPGLDGVASAPGENLALAVDCALEARAKIKIYKSFVLIDQADCLSGALWENAIRASENMLEDLTVILCRPSEHILSPVDNICAKFSAFGFDTFSAAGTVPAAVAVALQLPRRSTKPLFVCCDC